MKAALVASFKEDPQYKNFAEPKPTDTQVLINVKAASVNQLVKAKAAGTHYSSHVQPPIIPGVDGVGQLDNGQMVYFMATDPVYGTLAEQTLTDSRAMIPVPEYADPAVVAASVNPAMSSWMAVKERVGDIQGKTVLVLGATGHAGSLAVAISKYLGAKQVIALGRNQTKLAALDSDVQIPLTMDAAFKIAIAEIADSVDVVLDYLWGDVSQNVMLPLLTARSDHSQALTWVEIGSITGPNLVLPAAALRSTNLILLGSGQGGIAVKTFLKDLPELINLIAKGHFNVAVDVRPLASVHEAWQAKTDKRLVFEP